MDGLKPCPCGLTPKHLEVTGDHDYAKWQWVAGTCCGAWQVEFRSNYTVIGTPENNALAKEAWNAAPRAATGDGA